MQIKEVKLQSTNILALFSFYKTVLELPVSRSGNEIAISVGDTKLIFKESKEHENPFYHFAFNIPSNKFEEALQWMKQSEKLLWLDD